MSPEYGLKLCYVFFQDICPMQIFFSSNSYIFLVVYVGYMVPVPVGGIISLLYRSTSSSFLMRGARCTPFLYFTTTYCNTHSCKFWKLSLYLSPLVPSIAPTSGTLPLKVFRIPDFFFLVMVLCLPPLLFLSVPVLVLFLVFS